MLFLIGYGLYTIIITLAPAGMGANAIMRKASEIVKHDPDVSKLHRQSTPPLNSLRYSLPARSILLDGCELDAWGPHFALMLLCSRVSVSLQLAMVFGEMKTYGEDFGGGSTEGRRYYVPEYEYEDDITGVKYHRVRFNLEGERGRKATVWAETRAGSSSDFRYIIVMNKEQTRVWSIVDHRPAELSLHDRQASVSSLMQDAGWTFFADNEGDALEQAEALGDYWLKVRTVRCDLDRDRCVREGITSRPAWGMGPAEGPGVFSSAWDLLSNSASSVYKTAFGSGSGPDATVSGSAASDVEALARAPERPVWKVAKGTKSLRELELMTRDLAAKKRRGGSDGIVGSASAALSGAVDSFKDLLGLGSTSSSGSSSSAK